MVSTGDSNMVSIRGLSLRIETAWNAALDSCFGKYAGGMDELWTRDAA
jgi:hypothetical protein